MTTNNEFNFIVRPDLQAVSELMTRTWARPCWSYDVGLLEAHILRPSGDPSLNVGQVTPDGELVSFQAYMPFAVNYFGHRYRAVFASFLTVSPDFHGRGLAGPQQGWLIDQAKEQGYDIYLTMCEVGAASNRAVERIFAKKRLPVKIINEFSYLATARDLVGPLLTQQPSANTRAYHREDGPVLAEQISALGGDVPLKKIIPANDLDFLFLDRKHAVTFVYDDGHPRALANLLVLEVLLPDGGAQRNLYFDNVSFGDLSAAEQSTFLSDILVQLRSTEYQFAFVPNIGYLPVDAFRQLRFRTAPRRINLYLAALNEPALTREIATVDRFYLDVY
ncbi:MAG: hypothetical protein QNJ97_12190 [Myxococcota bacterium]|nr:hypothetical protein [Myxococcota bacterium]